MSLGAASATYTGTVMEAKPVERQGYRYSHGGKTCGEAGIPVQSWRQNLWRGRDTGTVIEAKPVETKGFFVVGWLLLNVPATG